MASLTLIRGLPGSGKSTLAKKMSLGYAQHSHFEADMYFIDQHGEYKFNQANLHEAHEWCQNNTKNMLSWGGDVIVSNTFTLIRELKQYFEIAKKFNVVPNIILCQSNFGSTHGVPSGVLDVMKSRFHYDISQLYN